MSEVNRTSIIFDLGTGYMKVGFAGSNFPQSVFPTIVGRPILRSNRSQAQSSFDTDVVVGEACDLQEGVLDTIFPVKDGIITDPENMRHIWDYCFTTALDIKDPRQTSVFVTEAANNPRFHKEHLFLAMFETYAVRRIKVVPQAVLTLCAQGLTTGTVFDSGDGVSHVMPVYESYLLNGSVRRLNIAGSHITRRLVDLLHVGGYYLNSSSDKVLARKLKEKFCFVAGDLEEMKVLEADTCFLRRRYEHENGSEIFVEKERYLAPEILFNPRAIGVADEGVHGKIFDAVYSKSTNMDMRKPLFQHIVLSGGTTMLRGLPTRLEREVSDLLRTKVLNGDEKRLKEFKMRIEDPPRRKYLVYHGASILASILESNEKEWISREDYEEKGMQLLSV